jgi:hypothetical protein
MSGDRWVGVVGIAAMLVLVGSGLVARRLPSRKLAILSLAWAAIFAAAFLIARMLA